MIQRKLAFVIAGAQKSGTTTLDAMFRQHSQVQMASRKETHFFDDEDRDWAEPDYDVLDSYFAERDSRLRGESTPITLYWRPAIRRLRAYNPDIRILLILRNPVTRAFSNWKHEYSSGRETVPFADAIRGRRERVRGEGASEGLHRFFSYIERGLYGVQLDYLSRYFPKRNVHCEIYEEFFINQQAGLERMARFLNIDRFPGELPDIHLNPAHNLVYPSALSQEDVAYLSGVFHQDIQRTEAYLGRRIPSWQVQVRQLVSAG